MRGFPAREMKYCSTFLGSHISHGVFLLLVMLPDVPMEIQKRRDLSLVFWSCPTLSCGVRSANCRQAKRKSFLPSQSKSIAHLPPQQTAPSLSSLPPRNENNPSAFTHLIARATLPFSFFTQQLHLYQTLSKYRYYILIPLWCRLIRLFF